MTVPISETIEAALGKIPLTLLVRGARLVNVFSGEIEPSTSIGVYKDTIVFVGDDDAAKYESIQTIDAQGKFAIPGLIDTHLHIESTMVTPRVFAAGVLPRGTTTVCADPHEIGNVLGKAGVRMMLEDAKDLPMRIYFFAPTCVPESDAVTPGAEISPADIEEMLSWEGIVGLGEVMDFEGVLAANPKMVEILEIGRKNRAVIDGHCVFLQGLRLDAYIASGPESDHENFEVSTALEKLRRGMYLKLRGPDILDAGKFVSALKEMPSPWNLIFVTDDVMPDRLLDYGHLDRVCRSFMNAGMDPIEVIRSATLRPAMHMRMHNLGAIAPGRLADILLLSDLKEFAVDEVISNGVLAAKGGKLVVNIPQLSFDMNSLGTVRCQLRLEDFRVTPPVANGSVSVNCIDFAPFASLGDQDSATSFLNMAITNLKTVEGEVRNGELVLGDLALVVVFERHGRSGSKSYGLARNLIRKGGVASSVAHDAHNLIVAGTNPEDMLKAAQLVKDAGGGIAAVRDTKTLARIEMPIAGLMSENSIEEMAMKTRELRKAFKEMGVIDHPYMPILCLLTLSVVPHARITDKGIFDVDNQRFVKLFGDNWQ